VYSTCPDWYAYSEPPTAVMAELPMKAASFHRTRLTPIVEAPASFCRSALHARPGDDRNAPRRASSVSARMITHTTKNARGVLSENDPHFAGATGKPAPWYCGLLYWYSSATNETTYCSARVVSIR
jgi:hypothetical protein